MPQLIASGLAALIGAGIGGWITSKVVTEDTRAKLRASAYSSYLTEAARALSIAQDRRLKGEDTNRLHHSSAILELTASRAVWCRAVSFMASVETDGYQKYSSLVLAMREEIKGEEVAWSSVDEECLTFLSD